VIFVVVLVVGMITLSYDSIHKHKEKVYHLQDALFDLTSFINKWFLQDLRRRNILMICSSSLMDINVIMSLYTFLRYSETYRFAVALAIFFGLRATLVCFCKSPYPEGYNWGYPGIMALFVPYGRTADFFYSGHVGICMIIQLEHREYKRLKMAAYTIFTMCCQIFLMVVCRAHYTIDLVSGLVYAHYIWILVNEYKYMIDEKLMQK
jgi:hypothetical protein